MIYKDTPKELQKYIRNLYITTYGSLMQQMNVCGGTWSDLKGLFKRDGHGENFETLVNDINTFKFKFETEFTIENFVKNNFTSNGNTFESYLPEPKTFRIFNEHEYPFNDQLENLFQTNAISMIHGKKSTGKTTLILQLIIHHLVDTFFENEKTKNLFNEKVIYIDDTIFTGISKMLLLIDEIVSKRIEEKKCNKIKYEAIKNFVLQNLEFAIAENLDDVRAIFKAIKKRIRNREIKCRLLIIKNFSHMIDRFQGSAKVKKPKNGEYINKINRLAQKYKIGVHYPNLEFLENLIIIVTKICFDLIINFVETLC